MKIFIVVDKIPSAIYNLSVPLEKHLPHLDIRILPVHPKRNDPETLFEAQKLLTWCDLLHVMYWKSGEVLRTTFPVEFERKTKLLSFHNPYDLEKLEWDKYYDMKFAYNTEIQLKVAGTYLIPYGIDLGLFKFNPDYTEEKVVEMTVGRIESKKGILEVARACQKLGYKFLLVGRVSEPDYMKEIAQLDCVEFLENVTDEELRDAYYRSAIHVCNSVDNFESGTLPIMEAMACGVPVLTRRIGQVPDLFNGNNMVVRDGAKDDMEDLESKLKEMMENRPVRERIREVGWESVKSRTHEIMARRINKLYYKLMGGDRWVSVIVPTFDRPDYLLKVLVGIENQTYQNIEVVVVDSGNISVEPLITAFRKESKRPIKYFRFENKGEYTLPKARNIGVQKALGDVLVFCDDRLVMEKEAVAEFEKRAVPKAFLYGRKDGSMKGFVENFSCILRSDMIAYGLFNERVDCYGGQTQATRERFESNGFMIEAVEGAKANSIGGTHRMGRRNEIIRAKFILQEFYDQ